MILVAKLDTNICGRLTKIGFMWFAKDVKLLENIEEIFGSMVVDLKAFILAPTQKKARKTTKQGFGRPPDLK